MCSIELPSRKLKQPFQMNLRQRLRLDILFRNVSLPNSFFNQCNELKHIRQLSYCIVKYSISDEAICILTLDYRLFY